ncbi:MAG TPA: adenylate/guanylate cyclase domain-containing protein [Candidatus Limnocylindria bacterium]|nr:adenylate/guanylate cyclase domain-containing protein [Candidatus Limnocylindria bacterium]
MPELPSGTVTFLFSDIEGSTRLAQERAVAWPQLLARHQEIVRAAIARNHGTEVDTQGDSFFVAFDSASSAVAAAADVQRALAREAWPEEARIRVRIGIHTGEAMVQDATYVGVAVHRAARITHAGHGGQVLVSAATRALLGDTLPDGVSLLALGRHRLRDLDLPEDLAQLVIEGLQADFPPLRTLDHTPNNLPSQATSFLGRHREIAEIVARLASTRLLTLTGPGGTGKTRLSLRAAAAAVDRFPDGVYFVPLGDITQLELVLPTIAHELGLPDRGGARPLERLATHLADRQVLIVLDNFEQVLGAARDVAELMSVAPRLGVLVTSRAPLHVYGEQEYPVPPLDVPDPRALPSAEAVGRYESVALFVERARAALPTFRLTDDNAAAVAEICVRLDGLPLAIELAAARIKLLSPQSMLERLGHRLSLLAGGARDLPTRQQTLRGAIEWSFDLLDEGDRRLFAAFATFVGGAAFDAIESVCRDDDYDVFECLASLVDKSLVRRLDGASGEPRFTMLETIREYAAERLDESGRSDEVRALHAAWYVDLAERAAEVIMGPDKRAWLDRLDEEHGNLRAALDWAMGRADVETAMRLVSALWRFWQMRGHLAEGLDRARAALALPGAEQYPECQARALDAAGGLAYWMGDGEMAASFYERELELQRALGNRSGEAWALYSLSFTDMYWGSVVDGKFDPAKLERARERIREAVRLYRDIGDAVGTALALWGEANVLWSLAPPVDSPEFAEVERRAVEAREMFDRIGDSFMVGWATYTVALTTLRRGLHDRSEELLAEALRIFHDAGDVTGYVLVLDGFAYLALLRGDRQRAARLSGAVAVLEQRTGTGLNPPNRTVLGFDVSVLHGDPEVNAAWAEGERMTTDDAIAYALGGAASDAEVTEA